MRPHPRPFEGDGVKRRIAPFAGVGVAAFALVPLLPAPADGAKLLLAFALVPPLLASALVVPWRTLPGWTQSLPPLAYFLVVALMRDGQGDALMAFTPLVMLPVFWFALHGTRFELGAAITALAITLMLPIALLGEPTYSDSEWVRAALWIVVAGVVGGAVQTLVRQRESLLERVSELALTDTLTGLPNRRAWDQELPRSLARAARWESPVCVAIIDLDRFKAFNDAAGHPRGDLLLKEACAAWRTRLREVDFLARYGGEEFAVILPDCELDQAVEVIDRVRAATPRGQTSSSGIACWDGLEAPEDLLLRADLALYDAKDGGRDRTSLAV